MRLYCDYNSLLVPAHRASAAPAASKRYGLPVLKGQLVLVKRRLKEKIPSVEGFPRLKGRVKSILLRHSGLQY